MFSTCLPLTQAKRKRLILCVCVLGVGGGEQFQWVSSRRPSQKRRNKVSDSQKHSRRGGAKKDTACVAARKCWNARAVRRGE
eukprot:11191928-Lingulodinium_polyedra.AAC.1